MCDLAQTLREHSDAGRAHCFPSLVAGGEPKSARLGFRTQHSLPDGNYDSFTFGPRAVQESREKPTFARHNRAAVNDDVELPEPTLLQFDGYREPIPD